MPPLPPAPKHSAPAAGPTPPSSTSTLCFPSPTSVADVINNPSPNTSATASTDTPAPSHLSTCNNHHPSALVPLPPQSPPVPVPPSLPFYYHRPELQNPACSHPLPSVTKDDFVNALNDFLARAPPARNEPPPVLANRIRMLLDHLDALAEKLTLKVTTALFEVLARTPCLSILPFLLADVSAHSSPVITDVRKSFRYPYLVANILANGCVAIRDAFVESKPLVTHLLSFLDGNVVLSTASPQPVSNITDTPHHGNPLPVVHTVFAHHNSIIVGNVVQILVSYLETCPEPLLEAIRDRPTFIPSLVNLLHIGSIPKLLNAIILDRCVDDVCKMDLGNVSFDRPMRYSLALLSDANIFHLLAQSFEQATQTIYSLVEQDDAAYEGSPEMYKAEQLSFNILQVYTTLVRKTLRAVRLQPTIDICRNLHVYGDSTTASAVSHILKAGIELFRGTDGNQVSTLNLALALTTDILKFVALDRECRVASVSGQPPSLDTHALEDELDPLLRLLVDLLIDIATTGPRHGQTRLRILELFVECQRVCSDRMVSTFDDVRFGEVAMKMMLIHPRNSLMQHVVCRGVESALISKNSEEFERHWLVNSKLVQKIMRTWHREGGTERWRSAAQAQEAPFLSALVHMACCVEHWMAMKREVGPDVGWVLEIDEVMDFLSEGVVQQFEEFCCRTLHGLLEAEKKMLGGPRPRRRPGMGGGNSMGGPFASFGTTSGALLRRYGSSTFGNVQGRAHLVRSGSAHRFGYVAPVSTSTSRNRFDDMFVEDDMEDSDMRGGFGGNSPSRSLSSFTSIFDRLRV